MNRQAFANILLSGPCNLRCPDCIGSQTGKNHAPSTLHLFPLPGLNTFMENLLERRINQISLTGIDTEPMLYPHQERLLEFLRSHLPEVQVSLHTNGTLILRRPEIFNLYDRATVSLPSRQPETCLKMTGSSRVLDLESILAVSRIPIKVSTLLTPHNIAEIPCLVRYCRSLGIRRMVLRKLYQGDSPAPSVQGWEKLGEFAGNPVYDAAGLEVCVWDFRRTSLNCLNLFPDGRVVDNYLLKPALIAHDSMH